MNLYHELRKVIVALNHSNIDYALCGGLAVAFYGYSRFTRDIDILVRDDSLQDVQKLMFDIGFEEQHEPFLLISETVRSLNQKSGMMLHRVVKIQASDLIVLDIMVIQKQDDSIFENKNWFDWEGIKICVISQPGLITMKRAAGRDQDLLDIKKLTQKEN